jgi:hypothetical protein
MLLKESGVAALAGHFGHETLAIYFRTLYHFA